MIAWAQKNRDKLRKRNKLHGINIIVLAGTAFFVVLHYAQTAIFYDGLGQDLPVISSQMSVIFLLVIVLLMEAPRRGLFWGAGKSWFSRIRPILIRYHGYYFAWAITFTYWYHPMETTLGHLFGFLYTFFYSFRRDLSSPPCIPTAIGRCSEFWFCAWCGGCPLAGQEFGPCLALAFYSYW